MCITNYKKKYKNSILSFVNRRRKITENQKNVIKSLWPKFGINYQKNINLNAIFDKKALIVVEIGFGKGICLIQNAEKFRNINFIGIEVYLPGILSTLKESHKLKLTNLKIIYHDAKEIINNIIPNKSIYLFQIFFPDPWNKKKHNKRRLIQEIFIKKIKNKLSKHGYVHITTDSITYFQNIKKIFNKDLKFIEVNIGDLMINNFFKRSLTKFEKNKKILEIVFKKI